MLRHVYASLQIAEGVRPKRLQELIGHMTLKLIMDTYGHLWPSREDDDRAAKVVTALGVTRFTSSEEYATVTASRRD